VLPTCPVPSVTDIPGRTTGHEFFRSLLKPILFSSVYGTVENHPQP
jgi:hypothetical protein